MRQFRRLKPCFSAILAAAVLLSGCAEPPEAPAAPRVIRKKIDRPPGPSTMQAPPGKADAGQAAATPARRPAEAAEPSGAGLEKPVAEKPAEPSGSALQATLAALIGSGGAKAGESPANGGYDPKGKIDPFRPLFTERNVPQAKSKPPEKRRQPLTPLEKVDLSQLRLVAIIRSADRDMALVEEASGKGYIVEKGTYIGVNSGRVIEIHDGGIVVEEEVMTVLGEPTIQHRELRLPKNTGE